MAKRQLIEPATPKTIPETKKTPDKQDKQDMWWEVENEIMNEFEFEGFSVYERFDRWWIEMDGDDDSDLILIEDPEEKLKFEETEELLRLGITEEKFDELRRLIE